MGQLNQKLQVMQNAIYPSIYVNSTNKPFIVKNGCDISGEYQSGRLFFRCTDLNANQIDMNSLNTPFTSACLCPQGFQIIFLHVGYSYISPLKLQTPVKPDINFINTQILKLCRPFVLGIVIQDLSNSAQCIYVQMNGSNDTLLSYISRSDDIGLVLNKHIFTQLPYNKVEIISQYQQDFQQSAYHTLIPVVRDQRLSMYKSTQYQLDQFQQIMPKIVNGEQLIGVAYRNKNDLYPVCIYGYNYDIQVFKYPITANQNDLFNQSQLAYNVLKKPKELVQGIQSMINSGFGIGRANLKISASDYILIRNQLSSLISGQILIYGSNLFGKIDGPMDVICKEIQYGGTDMCSCLNPKLGNICLNRQTNPKCQLSGYKNQLDIDTKCTNYNQKITIIDKSQTSNLSVTAGGSINLGNINQQQNSSQSKTSLSQ